MAFSFVPRRSPTPTRATTPLRAPAENQYHALSQMLASSRASATTSGGGLTSPSRPHPAAAAEAPLMPCAYCGLFAVRAHQSKCPRRPASCADCGRRDLTAAGMGAHRKECPAGTAACPGCGDPRVRAELQAHISSGECRGRSFSCEGCGTSFEDGRLFAAHAYPRCRSAPLACQLCGEAVPAAALAQHYVRCAQRNIENEAASAAAALNTSVGSGTIPTGRGGLTSPLSQRSHHSDRVATPTRSNSGGGVLTSSLSSPAPVRLLALHNAVAAQQMRARARRSYSGGGSSSVGGGSIRCAPSAASGGGHHQKGFMSPTNASATRAGLTDPIAAKGSLYINRPLTPRRGARPSAASSVSASSPAATAALNSSACSIGSGAGAAPRTSVAASVAALTAYEGRSAVRHTAAQPKPSTTITARQPEVIDERTVIRNSNAYPAVSGRASSPPIDFGAAVPPPRRSEAPAGHQRLCADRRAGPAQDAGGDASGDDADCWLTRDDEASVKHQRGASTSADSAPAQDAKACAARPAAMGAVRREWTADGLLVAAAASSAASGGSPRRAESPNRSSRSAGGDPNSPMTPRGSRTTTDASAAPALRRGASPNASARAAALLAVPRVSAPQPSDAMTDFNIHSIKPKSPARAPSPSASSSATGAGAAALGSSTASVNLEASGRAASSSRLRLQEAMDRPLLPRAAPAPPQIASLAALEETAESANSVQPTSVDACDWGPAGDSAPLSHSPSRRRAHSSGAGVGEPATAQPPRPLTEVPCFSAIGSPPRALSGGIPRSISPHHSFNSYAQRQWVHAQAAAGAQRSTSPRVGRIGAAVTSPSGEAPRGTSPNPSGRRTHPLTRPLMQAQSEAELRADPRFDRLTRSEKEAAVKDIRLKLGSAKARAVAKERDRAVREGMAQSHEGLAHRSTLVMSPTTSSGAMRSVTPPARSHAGRPFKL